MLTNPFEKIYPGDPLPTASQWGRILLRISNLENALRRFSGGGFSYIGESGAVIAGRKQRSRAPQSSGGAGNPVQLAYIDSIASANGGSNNAFSCRTLNPTTGLPNDGSTFVLAVISYPKVTSSTFQVIGYQDVRNCNPNFVQGNVVPYLPLYSYHNGRELISGPHLIFPLIKFGNRSVS